MEESTKASESTDDVVEIIDIEDGEIDDDQNSVIDLIEKTPIFEIIFRDELEFEKHGNSIMEVLKKHLKGQKFEYLTYDSLESGRKNDCKNNSISISAYEVDNFAENEKARAIDQGNSTKTDSVIDCDQGSNDSTDYGADLNRLFTIDPLPSTKLETDKVPSYKRSSKDVLNDIEEKKPKNNENSCPRPKPTSCCFNCGSNDHGIRDCRKPRNMQRINRAKKAFSSNQRYHIDNDQRFTHLKPGIISSKLKRALRLHENEIPSFFYRMRECGYPPGWLEEAKVAHSGLAMFNSETDVLKFEDNIAESQNDIKFDIAKIIEFPGFNIKPENFNDEYKYHNVRPFSQRQSKEAMIESLGEHAIKGFKRKKIKDHSEESTVDPIQHEPTQLDISQNEDMEIEDAENVDLDKIEFTRPMPPTEPPVEDCDVPAPPELPPTIDNTSTLSTELNTSEENKQEERIPSPTLEELQAEQAAILLKLTNGKETLSKDVSPTSIPNTPTTPDVPATPTPDVPATPPSPSTSLPINEDKNVIKSSHIGTPVLKFSPYDKLPAGDKFRVGVSDVINFENLPDSTGKYKMMKEVLNKVRTIKKSLSEENE